MVKIITDTTACLPQDYVNQHHIPVIPQIVNFGEESYYEGLEIDNATFLRRLQSAKELPKTAAPPPELFREQFERLTTFEEAIFCIHPSAEVSGTVRSATVAAQDFPKADIRVIDSRLVASPLGTLVQEAVKMAEEGFEADQIEAYLADLRERANVYFLVPTLEYLAKGGRIGGASALVGSVLQIKPILTMKDGIVQPFDKARTQKRALARMVEIVVDGYPSDERGFLSVMQAAAPEQAEELAQTLKIALGLETIPIHNLPPAIVVHGGPGVLGVSFFSAKDGAV